MLRSDVQGIANMYSRQCLGIDLIGKLEQQLKLVWVAEKYKFLESELALQLN